MDTIICPDCGSILNQINGKEIYWCQKCKSTFRNEGGEFVSCGFKAYQIDGNIVYCCQECKYSFRNEKGNFIKCPKCEPGQFVRNSGAKEFNDTNLSPENTNDGLVSNKGVAHVNVPKYENLYSNKNVEKATVVALVLLAIVIAVCILTPSVSPKSDAQPDITEAQKATISDAPPRTINNTIKHTKIPKYKVLHTGTSFCDYEILINPVNLNSITYKSDVEAILDDIASKHKATSFTVWFYDNAQAAKLNYNDLELGEHLTKPETKLVDYHIVAIYGNPAGYYFISYFENIASDDRVGCKAWKEAFNENDFKNGYTPSIISNEHYNRYNDSIQKNQNAIIAAKEISAQKAWDKSKAGRIQKKHPDWSKEDCINIANNRIWIGMEIMMVKCERGNPNSINPSDYGQGRSYQWCWEDYTPSCFYGREDGIVTAYN